MLACDVAPECISTLQSHEHPPESIVDNLLHFLSPGCVHRCRKMCDKAGSLRSARQRDIDSFKAQLTQLKDKQRSKQSEGKRKKPAPAKSKSNSKSKGTEFHDDINKKISNLDSNPNLELKV